ncbi:MAG: hypothetical protein HYY50_03470 [Candidatus Kerfeldbacteria bacterium]|nr:hypothetical protein [Candidatus Kerfeldbacteria bacterium]
MDYQGTIIEESLEDASVLSGLRIIKTDVKPATEKERTPWVKQWTLHTINIPQQRAEVIARKIMMALDRQHPWYADFKNARTHYIIFRDKMFRVDRTKRDSYQPATDHGLSLGIPYYQLDFSAHILVAATKA